MGLTLTVTGIYCPKYEYSKKIKPIITIRRPTVLLAASSRSKIPVIEIIKSVLVGIATLVANSS